MNLMGRNLELALQPLALETIQTIIPIIPITRIAPTQTPAWKMSRTGQVGAQRIADGR
jgi:hypothetical protein